MIFILYIYFVLQILKVSLISSFLRSSFLGSIQPRSGFGSGSPKNAGSGTELFKELDPTGKGKVEQNIGIFKYLLVCFKLKRCVIINTWCSLPFFRQWNVTSCNRLNENSCNHLHPCKMNGYVVWPNSLDTVAGGFDIVFI